MPVSVKLEKFTDEEKAVLTSFLKKRLLFIGGIYLGVILISIAFIYYFNKYSENYRIHDNMEVINVVFVVIGVLCGRLLFSEVIGYGKEIKSENKKVVQTKIIGRKDGKVTLGNKSFNEEDFIFGAVGFDSLQSGDSVIIELSAKSDTLFRIRRI